MKEKVKRKGERGREKHKDLSGRRNRLETDVFANVVHLYVAHACVFISFCV